MHQRVLAAKIFIIPDFTLVWELVLFLVILTIMWRFVVPPIQRSMRERREIVRRELEEAEKARERLTAAEAEYAEALAATRSDATRLREEARGEGQRVVEEARARAAAEYETQAAEYAGQLDEERVAVLSALRPDIGRLSVDLANKVVGEPLDDLAERSGTVERFLDGTAAGARVAAASGGGP